MPEIPNVPIPVVPMPGGDAKPAPLFNFKFDNPSSNYVTGPTTYNTDPALYDLDKVALQSGATNMWNSFIQGVNQTQISSEQYGLFNNQKRIADIEGGVSFRGALADLESQHLNKQIDDTEYQIQKNELSKELNLLYQKNASIQDDIYKDQDDISNNPVSKQYQAKEQSVQRQGSAAGLMDSLIYTQPSVMGSSAATMGATVLNAFGANAFKKVATRVAATFVPEPYAPFVAAGVAMGTMAEILYQARALESQAEVGGQISQDFEQLKSDYLQRTGKTELTKPEYNELISQAHKGSSTQYWKNMSLAMVDAAQSMLLAGSVGKWFGGVANTNKLTRLGAKATELWLTGKAESMEEGVQYAFGKEKSAAAMANRDNDPNGFWSTVGNSRFVKSLGEDYVDTLSSLNYGPIKGNGKYSGDKDFEFSTDSGFLMGVLMGGAHGSVQVGKDLYGYRNAVKELEKAGIESGEGNVFKFKSDVYKQFFRPSSGLFGLTGTESEDRVHYLTEAIKTLGKKKDGTGNTILTQDEVKSELQNINKAYGLYNKLSGYLDNLSGGYRKEQSALFNFAKAKFEDAAFRESMQMMFHTDKLNKAEAAHMDAVASDQSPDSDLKASKIMLETINNRIDRINSMQIGEEIRDRKVKLLESKKKDLQSLIAQQELDFKALGVPESVAIAPEIASASEDLLTAQMFKAETDTKYKNLFKVKNSKQLIAWLNKTATEEAQNGWTEANEAISAIKQEEYKTDLEQRQAKPFTALTDDEKIERTAANRKLLKAESFADTSIDALNEDELEKTANDILDAYSKGNLYIDERTFTSKLANVKSQDEYDALYDIPGFKEFVDKTYPNLNRTSPIDEVVKTAKAKQQTQQGKKKPGAPKLTNVGSVGRSKTTGDRRTEAGILADIKAKNNKAKAGDILMYIKNSTYATAAEKELARQLLETNDTVLNNDIVFDSTLTAPAEYKQSTDQITVNLQYIADDYESGIEPFETVLLHELIHQFTVKSFRNPDNADLFKGLNDLYAFVTNDAKTKNLTNKFYGLSSVDEMVTEAFTNPEFQSYLKGLSYANVKQTAWDVFMGLVNDALRALGITTDNTALDAVIGLTTDVIGRRNRESFSAISTRISNQLVTKITESNTTDQNIEAAASIFKDVYDIPNLSPTEFTNLETLINTFLAKTNNTIEAKAKNKITFGSFTFVPGNFLVTKDKKTIFNVDKQNSDGSILVTYTYKPQNATTPKLGSRIISDPNDIEQVFTDKSEALNYIKGKTTTQPVVTTSTTQAVVTAPEVDEFAKALNALINYKPDATQYGALDPKLMAIAFNFMTEAAKAGHKSFSAMSAETIKRTNEATYKAIFENLRKTYVANFADLAKKVGLTDTPEQLMGLISGTTTADSVIANLKAPIPVTNNEYTGSTATPIDEQSLLAANIQDKVSGNVMKSTGQQFLTDARGLWTNQEDTDPVKQRYYNFINRMSRETSNGKTMSELGYFGLLIQDGESLPDGTPIPHEQNTIDYFNKLKAQNKPIVYGQIVLVVDKDNKPIKMNQNGEVDNSGDLVVFNIENVSTVANKDIGVVARVNGITEAQAKVLIANAAAEMQRIRTAAKGGYPIVLELSPKPGVPVFTEQGQSTAPLSKNNYEIEIATVKKDDTNIGYFVNHPNNTGYLGGAYVFVNGVPVKVEPNAVTEDTANLVVAILDAQVNSGLNIDEIKSRSKFLNDLIYQNYSKNNPAGTFYFRDSDVYIDGVKVDKANRKAAILKNGRYNIVSTLLNNNFTPYGITESGNIIKLSPRPYNEFLLNRSTTKAVIRGGNKVLANSYFNFKPGKSITNWAQTVTKKTEVKPVVQPQQTNTVSAFNKPYLAKDTQKGSLVISMEDFLANIDWEETAIGGFEEYVEDTDQMRLIKVDIKKDGSRQATIYFDRGEGLSSGSSKHTVDLKPLSLVQPEVIEAPKVEPIVTSKIEAEVKNAEDFTIEEMAYLPDINPNLDTHSILVLIDSIDDNKGNRRKVIQKVLELVNNKVIPLDKEKQVLSTKEKLIGNNDYYSEDYLKKYVLYSLKDFGNAPVTTSLGTPSLFASTPMAEGYFPKTSLSTNQANTSYNLYVNGNSAKFTLDPTRVGISGLADYRSSYIEPAFDLVNQPTKNTQSIITREAGEAILQDGKWVITKKGSVEFSDTPGLSGYTPATKQETKKPTNSLEAKKAAAKEKLRKQNEQAQNNQQYKEGTGDILFYGKLTAGINNTIGNNLFNATQSITVVKSIDRIIYDFIHSYDKSVVDVLNQPQIVQAAYKYAYKVFTDQLVNLNNDYETKIDAAETEEELDVLTQELATQADKFNKVINNWNDIVAYHQNHSKTFVIKGETIYFTYDEEGNIQEENDDSKTEKPKNSFDAVQGNEISSIDGANKETKALIRGLAKQTFNEFGIRELVDFGSTWNNLAINLAGTMEYTQMLEKLEKLSITFPEYGELLDKLQTSKAKDTLTHNQISQIAKFRQDFSKPYIAIYETVFDPATESYKILEATKNNISAIEDSYFNNFSTSSPNQYIKPDQYGTNILTNEIKNLKIDSLTDKLVFLRTIGVKISEGTIRDPRVHDVISGKAVAAMKNSLVKLVESGIPVVNPLAQLRIPNTTLNLPGESGNIDAILKLESVYNRNNASASMINAEGSTVYALGLHNFLTISNGYLSNAQAYPTYQDIIALPHMKHLDIDNNPYVRNSVWMNEMFNLDQTDNKFGERRKINGQPVILDIINFNGLKVQQEQGASDGSTTTNLWIGDKLVQDFNSLLISGTKEMMRAGDKASAFSVKINGFRQISGRPSTLPIRIEDFSQGFGGLQATTVFSGYLVDELTRMQQARFENVGSNLDFYKNSSKSFNLFRDILPSSIKEKLENDLKADTDISVLVAGIQKEMKDGLREFFNKQVADKTNSFNSYQFPVDQQATWIDQNLRNQYEVSQLMRAYVVNAFILNVEQTKVFNGDGAFYKAFHKRNSKDSSTGTTMMTDTWFIDWLNQNPNANLQAKLLGVTNEITNVTNTVVFKDNIVASAYTDIYRAQLTELGMPKEQIDDIVSKYSVANEGDAQGWITLDFYRTFKLSQGKWYAAHEAVYEKASRGEVLTSDEVFYFMPIKAQYAGPLKYNGAFAPAFHKFSLVPLIPSVIKGTKMQALNEKMLRNNVGYGLFESGSKVATVLNEDGKKENFYKNYETREAVNASESFTAINPIFNHYLKEQVNIEPSLHDEVIFGTQFRKLLFQNLFNEGKEVGDNPRWEKLYNEYSHALDQLVFNEKQRLLEELGIQETETGYKNVNFNKLVDKFQKEAKRRDMNDNVQSFMEYDEATGGFKYPLDASTNRQQIQNMIMSMINNRLVRQHMKGDLMVQVSGAGFEKYNKPTDAQVEKYGSNGLRFYHMKDGKTQAMQVKVALTGDFANLIHFTHNDGQPIRTIDRLNEMIVNDEWMAENRKSVTMIGYRIPTQGLNSIEFMEVAEFLPVEAGNIIILSTEVVIKNGGDFDIDKLSIFKPSIRARTRGKKTTANYTVPKFISLKTSITTQKEQADLKYKPELAELRDQLTKISDDKYLDTRYLYELRNKLKTDLNEDISNTFDKLMTLNHDKKHLEIEIAFKRDDIDMLMKEQDVVGINDEIAAQLTVAKDDLKELNQAYNANFEARNQARADINTAKGVKTGLLDSAETIISNYMNDFYVNFGTVNDKYQDLYNEYKNKLEDLYAFKGGIQNRIIEIGTEVLQAKENFIQLITPNDTGLIKPMITDEGGIKQKNGYPLKTDYTGTAIYTEKSQEEKFLAGLVGKKALGIAAVNNTFTQLFQQINLHVQGEYLMPNRGAVKTYIRLLENQTGTSFNFAKTVDEKGILKSEFISQMINAYVDVLNDDFIFYANAGLDVAPVLFYMKNAGVSTEKMFYFINHPVIKYFINNTQATKSHILKATNPQYYDADFRPEMSGSFKNEMFKAIVGSSGSKISIVREGANKNANENPILFTENYLKNQISKELSQIGYIERSAILGHFLQLQEQADWLRKFQAANSYDTSTAPNPVASANFNALAKEVQESKFIKPEYQKAMSNTVIKAYNVTDFVSSMFDTLMPTTLSKQMVDYMLNIHDQVTDRDKLTRLFTNDLLMYIFTNYVNLTGLKGQPTPFDYINGTQDYPSQNRFTSIKEGNETKQIDNRLSKRIRFIKNSGALASLRAEYPIIEALRVEEVRKNDGFTNLTIYRGENTTDTQNSLIEQFSKLANLSDPKYTPEQQLYVRKLFRDLALYGFLQSGLNKSPISFTDIIPNELYTPLVTKGLAAFQNDITARGFKTVMDEYNLKFIQNNAELFGTDSNMASYRSKNYRNYNITLNQSGSLTETPKVTAKTTITEVKKGTINFQESKATGYSSRTTINASAPATIAIAVDFGSAGERLTKNKVIEQGNEYIPISIKDGLPLDELTISRVAAGLVKAGTGPLELNIAGNGIYTMKGVYAQEQLDNYVTQLLSAVNTYLKANTSTEIGSIRSGGQTGLDEAGIKAGLALGLPVTILAPKGWTFRNIDGQDISNEQQFKARFDYDDNVSIQGTLFYGKLENSQESRIFNSRNVATDKQVDDVLSRMEEQSKPCNG